MCIRDRVKVAVARKLADHQDILTYQVPENLQRQVQAGSMVMVPMGRGNQPVNGLSLIHILRHKKSNLAAKTGWTLVGAGWRNSKNSKNEAGCEHSFHFLPYFLFWYD